MQSASWRAQRSCAPLAGQSRAVPYQARGQRVQEASLQATCTTAPGSQMEPAGERDKKGEAVWKPASRLAQHLALVLKQWSAWAEL
eukprot:1161895-Pelagomonas_calceolata.AAC.7